MMTAGGGKYAPTISPKHLPSIPTLIFINSAALENPTIGVHEDPPVRRYFVSRPIHSRVEGEAMTRSRSKTPTNILILGAAGRDFHNFNCVFREDPDVEVVGFTATQIPNIEGRRYPAGLAGSLYPDGIPIYSEDDMEALIQRHEVDQVVFAYSDLPHAQVMHLASRALIAGADFRLLSPESTMLASTKPVISICAVRTGCGKSPAARRIASILRGHGIRVGIIRHPMPYGDLEKQAVQRFDTMQSLKDADCTIEEMEEYAPHIENGDVIFAGVDFERILRLAEQESDIILWDGGNNDTSFYLPDLKIVLLDPHRIGHERTYFPGEVNFLGADVLLMTKLDSATPEAIDALKVSAATHNPGAQLLSSQMTLKGDDVSLIQGKRALVIEDGPTLTHGEMTFGAGFLAAKQFGASEIVDPRPYAVGSIAEVYDRYPHIAIEKVLPAMGYGEQQQRELAETIAATDCDVVVMATPVDFETFVSH